MNDSLEQFVNALFDHIERRLERLQKINAGEDVGEYIPDEIDEYFKTAKPTKPWCCGTFFNWNDNIKIERELGFK